MISTRLTRMLDIRHPVVLAPLGGVGRAELVAAVCNAGGFGLLGMNRMSPEFIRDQIHKTPKRQRTPNVVHKRAVRN